MNKRLKQLLPFLLTAGVVVLDRITKHMVVTHMRLHESIPFIGNLVRWTYVHNDGMVFGYHMPLGLAILKIVSVIAVIILGIVLYKAKDQPWLFRWVMAGILGGAIGNTWDRIHLGYVIDFIDVDMPNWIMDRFAVFNVADSFISVGVVLLILVLLFRARGPESEEDELLEGATVDSSTIFSPESHERPEDGDALSDHDVNNDRVVL